MVSAAKSLPIASNQGRLLTDGGSFLTNFLYLGDKGDGLHGKPAAPLGRAWPSVMIAVGAPVPPSRFGDPAGRRHLGCARLSDRVLTRLKTER